MKTIKLTKTQSDNLRTAMLKEQQTSQAFRQAQAQAAEASNHRAAILEMIYETHGIDPKAVDPQGRLNLAQDGTLSIPEVNASKRIKKELARGAVKRASDKKSKGKVVRTKTT